MAFVETLESTLPSAVGRLARHAHMWNRIAQTCTDPASRLAANRAKVWCISKLLVIGGAAQLEEVLPGAGLITVTIPAGRIRVPVSQLDARARRAVARRLQEYIAKSCS